MTDEHIDKIKSAVEAADHIPAEQKAELLDRLSKVKPALSEVAQTNREGAQSIATLVEGSTQEHSQRQTAGSSRQSFVPTETVRRKVRSVSSGTRRVGAGNIPPCSPHWVFKKRNAACGTQPTKPGVDAWIAAAGTLRRD
jgi:hypothetical protein